MNLNIHEGRDLADVYLTSTDIHTQMCRKSLAAKVIQEYAVATKCKLKVIIMPGGYQLK